MPVHANLVSEQSKRLTQNNHRRIRRRDAMLLTTWALAMVVVLARLIVVRATSFSERHSVSSSENTTDCEGCSSSSSFGNYSWSMAASRWRDELFLEWKVPKERNKSARKATNDTIPSLRHRPRLRKNKNMPEERKKRRPKKENTKFYHRRNHRQH